jgi:periplasmic glucans biosynthesis protein
MANTTRRNTLALLGGLAAAGLMAGRGRAQDLDLAEEQSFSFEWLKSRARELSEQPWSGPESPHREVVARIDYDDFQRIAFRRDASLWAKGEGTYPVQFFHLGRFFAEPATIHVVEDGRSREIVYRKSYFDMPADHPAQGLPDNVGYAGFRTMYPEQDRDWLAFLGASYFRAAGPLDQYGLSARGIAVDTGLSTPEEFPRFTAFYLQQSDGEDLTIHALLEGPSLTGAYRMVCSPDGATLMDVDCDLYIRSDIERLGIAPLTSMFWYGQIDRTEKVDWRPRIHDSEGLAIWTGTDERIWRPLQNPPRVMTNSFVDDGPRGFGLLQRNRDFDAYQDDGVFYDRRPSLWVEPRDDWGAGHVQLLEIPTDDEIHDNIGAYWVSDAPVRAGQHLQYRYRLHWVDDEPYPSDRARVVNSFSGIGGTPGQPRPEGMTRFVVDFEGENLAGYDRGALQAVVSLSRGEVQAGPAAYPIARWKGRWRAYFDVADSNGGEPVDLRLVLQDAGGTPVSETWIYQFFAEGDATEE